MATWLSDGWKFLQSSMRRQPDGRYLVWDTYGRSYSPRRYEAGNGPELFDQQVVTYFLPVDMIERDRFAPGGSLYFSHTHWLAIREIHLSGQEPKRFQGRDLPTISEKDARR